MLKQSPIETATWFEVTWYDPISGSWYEHTSGVGKAEAEEAVESILAEASRNSGWNPDCRVRVRQVTEKTYEPKGQS